MPGSEPQAVAVRQGETVWAVCSRYSLAQNSSTPSGSRPSSSANAVQSAHEPSSSSAKLPALTMPLLNTLVSGRNGVTNANGIGSTCKGGLRCSPVRMAAR